MFHGRRKNFSTSKMDFFLMRYGKGRGYLDWTDFRFLEDWIDFRSFNLLNYFLPSAAPAPFACSTGRGGGREPGRGRIMDGILNINNQLPEVKYHRNIGGLGTREKSHD